MQEDVIYRQAAIDALMPIYKSASLRNRNVFSTARKCMAAIEDLPSAEPELDEWCTDCKEYDQERHCCPRWNRVIRETLKDVERKPGRWIPCSERLPEYMEPVLTWDGGAYCVEKRIPVIRDSDTGEEIPGDWWVSDDYDEYESDYYPNLRDGACIAWMPLPEPWKGGTT